MGDPIQLLISIDVEPDDQQVDRDDPGPWRGFEDLLRQIAPFRRRFAERTGRPAHFAWYWRLDPQIEEAYGAAAWPLRMYAAAIDDLSRAEDAFGVHTHAWRWSRERRSWFADHANRTWVSRCLHSSFDTFERYFQAPCTAHRFGHSWIDDAALDEIERLGADYDLTIEAGHPPGPVHGWRKFNTGEIPDLRQVPKRPYRRGRIWIVPVSGASLVMDGAGGLQVAGEPDRRPRQSNPLDRLFAVASRFWPTGSPASRSGAARKGPAGGRRPRPRFWALNIPFLRPEVFACAFEHALSASRSRYVHTVARAGDLARPDMRANFLANMDFLSGHPLAHRFQVSTPGRLAASWAQ